MAREDRLSHAGTVVAVDSATLEVEIVAQSACAACHAKSLCSLSEQKAKRLTVPRPPGRDFTPGQSVTVEMRTALGLMAVAWVYGLPFLIFITSLLVFSAFMLPEYVVGLIIFVILLLYYLVLYGFRNKFKRRVYFTLK